ncbi:MAG: undecaprenyldiphospho-muramoylpentapeptide beta-N-acetylglucosaminyltransferase [Oscillospiraceae bacterium]|jgi:UDP-N-acetylglucosamine--N-acetylmuramyl-(pentapeptide) pyrophosphoryl-undecaprenol N-acetylglucosamine transferase
MSIIIGAGGSGGHVFPALETAKKLRDQDQKVIFLTTKGLAFDLIRKNDFEAWIIDPPRIKLSSFLSAIKEVWRMLITIVDTCRLVNSLSPKVVVGFGGYGAFPVVAAAILKNIPTLIHEQNVVPSRTNQILSKFVTRIALSFEQSRKYFSSKKVVFTGCPCRNSPSIKLRADIYKKFGFSPDKKTIFVLGGSQGSRRINEEFSKAVVMLQGIFDFQFIHLCGKTDYDWLKKEYTKLRAHYQLFDFLDDVQSAYTVADLVIARSGAVTVCEILSFQKRAILIPYPLVRVHQKENAQVVVEKGLGILLEDQECFATRLKSEILKVFESGNNTALEVSITDEYVSNRPQEKIAQEIIRLVL